MTTAERRGSEPSAGSGGTPAPGRLRGFDGLRAIAALSIVAYHAVLFSRGLSGSRLWDVLIQLRSGVWIFFVLSGFLLYRPHVAAHLGRRPTPAVPGYATNRVLRIFPAYWVVLIVLTFVVTMTKLQNHNNFLVQLGLLQIYSRQVYHYSPPLDVTWSLATELSFYVFLPFFAFAVARAARRYGVLRAEVVGLAAVVAIGVAWQITMHGKLLQSLWLPNFFPVFALGMGLAVAAAHLRPDAVPWLRALAARGGLCWTLALAVLVTKGLVLPGDFGVQQGHSLVPQICFTLFAFFMVVPFVLGRDAASGVHRFASTRVMIFLGTISYGIFLWHQAAIRWINFDWATQASQHSGWTPLVFLLALAVTIPIATASWYLVERPALSLKTRFARV